jgi:hypothetical protein
MSGDASAAGDSDLRADDAAEVRATLAELSGSRVHVEGRGLRQT